MQQYTSTSYLSVQQSKLSPKGALDDQMALLHEAEYEIVVLLPNSELTKGNNKSDADVRTVRLRRKTMVVGLFKLQITSLIVARNIQCGYSFS